MSSSQRRIHQHWSSRDIVHRILDAGAIIAGLLSALQWTTTSVGPKQWTLAAVAVIAYYLVAEISGMYRNWRGVSTEREVLCAVMTWGFALLGLGALTVMTHTTGVVRATTLWIWFVNAPILIASSRILIRGAMRFLRARGVNMRRYAIIGINELAFQLARNVEESVEMGLTLAGLYDDREKERLPEIPPDIGHHVGNLDELVERARNREVDMIYITFPMRAEDRIREILDRLSDTTASVYLVPDFFVFELLHSRWTSISGLPVVSVFENPFYGIDGMVKRALDVCLAGLLLLFLAIPMAVIAAAVKRSSPGPIFFRQKRYGLDGRQIMVWKFRSMTCCEDGETVAQATQGDVRVTKLGAFLRRSSLDELPQLFNVLSGNMSLVGPRPHANTHNEEYRSIIDGYMLRHKVKPGITGLAQVSGFRGETDTLDKMSGRVACDHQYIREWSLWMDIKILFRTVFVVFSQQNAH